MARMASAAARRNSGSVLMTAFINSGRAGRASGPNRTRPDAAAIRRRTSRSARLAFNTGTVDSAGVSSAVRVLIATTRGSTSPRVVAARTAGVAGWAAGPKRERAVRVAMRTSTSRSLISRASAATSASTAAGSVFGSRRPPESTGGGPPHENSSVDSRLT